MATPTKYELELVEFGDTYRSALTIDLKPIKTAISAASETSVIGVGSGGSYTVASLLCNLHESFTGRVSRASTPLELICNPTLAASSPVFLISAEGKNPDILEALNRSRQHSARSIHILTNRGRSPLTDLANGFTEVNQHVFELSKKDGYLATNSLLLDAIVVARSYSELSGGQGRLPDELGDLSLASGPISDWLKSASLFVREAVLRKGLIITFSPLLKAVATDLESKLSEAALLYSQVPDLRSFAHGRHLWLADRPNDCAILAIIEPTTKAVWEHTRSLIPADVPVFSLETAGSLPADLIAGLVAQMHFVSELGKVSGRDPGKPNVPEFGRALYYAPVEIPSPKPQAIEDSATQAKFDVLGARWPSVPKHGPMFRAHRAYADSLIGKPFRAIVFDYDGTLCSSQRRAAPPDEKVMEYLAGLLDRRILVGIASGRGDSILPHLQNAIPQEHWPLVHVGLYNGGWVSTLEREMPTTHETSEYLQHISRIANRLKDLGAPIELVRVKQPYQVGIRFFEGVSADAMWIVIADAIRQAGLDITSVVKSKHSVDILGANVGKTRLVAEMILQRRIDPYEILTLGDQGAWPGNDYSLLDHKYSLSVDVPSRRLDRGWKLAPSSKRDVDATLWYLDRIHIIRDGQFSIKLD